MVRSISIEVELADTPVETMTFDLNIGSSINESHDRVPYNPRVGRLWVTRRRSGEIQ